MLKLNSRQVGPPDGFVYRQPETGRLYRESGLSALLKRLREHRRAHGIPMPEGWEAEVEDQICLQIGDESLCHDPESHTPFRSALERMGRELWRALHSKGLSIRQEYLSDFEACEIREWLSRWEEGIPNWGGCACRQHYFEIKQSLPPDFSSGRSFYEWGVSVHNSVNQLLGKPLWSIPA